MQFLNFMSLATQVDCDIAHCCTPSHGTVLCSLPRHTAERGLSGGRVGPAEGGRRSDLKRAPVLELCQAVEPASVCALLS